MPTAGCPFPGDRPARAACETPDEMAPFFAAKRHWGGLRLVPGPATLQAAASTQPNEPRAGRWQGPVAPRNAAAGGAR